MKEEEFFNLKELVRSLQRAEGKQDCFRLNPDSCDKVDCTWRSSCLKRPTDESKNLRQNFFNKAVKGGVREILGGEHQWGRSPDIFIKGSGSR